MLGCAIANKSRENRLIRKGVGEARPEEILLRISYRIVNAQRTEKLKPCHSRQYQALDHSYCPERRGISLTRMESRLRNSQSISRLRLVAALQRRCLPCPCSRPGNPRRERPSLRAPPCRHFS